MLILLFFSIIMSNIKIGDSDTFDAREQIKNCISCEISNHTTKSLSKCIRCVQLIILNQNFDCPSGYSYIKDHRVTLHDYMNSTCGAPAPLFMAKTWSVMAGITTGTCISVIVMIVLVVYLKFKKSESNQSLCKESNSTDSFRSHSLYYSDRPEFLKNISILRSQAPIFLSMLNETRRQIRELRKQKPPRQMSALQAYRPVLRDLSRILILLNRNQSSINNTVPPTDWETLFAWGERVLTRYKTQNPHKVAQLYNLMDPNDGSGPKLGMVTFQPALNHQAAISAFEDKYDMHGDCTILAEWPSSTISRVYIDDDDFDSLGNRPQDQITTEL